MAGDGCVRRIVCVGGCVCVLMMMMMMTAPEWIVETNSSRSHGWRVSATCKKGMWENMATEC